jgi:alcohol dehydrogenase
MGIAGPDGCLAEYCGLPVSNLYRAPDGIPDERAVFTEPLSAACHILSQVSLNGSEKIVVLGDGRMGILCAWVLTRACHDVTIPGHHPEKLMVAGWRLLKTESGMMGAATRPDVVKVILTTGDPPTSSSIG